MHGNGSRKEDTSIVSSKKSACVIIPVHNCEKTIKRCVNSYLNQTYDKVDIILVNDGSTDMSCDICNYFLKRSDRITLITQDNRGVSAARNRGIEEAEKNDYEYLFFADADDYAEPYLIEECITTAKQQKVEFVISGYYFETENESKPGTSIDNGFVNIALKSRDDIKLYFTRLWDAGMLYNIWNKLFILDIIRTSKLRFPIGKVFNEDRDFVRDYMRNTKSLAVINKCLYHYNRSDNTATGKYRENLFEIRREEYLNLKKFFEEYGVTDEEAYEFLARQHTDRIVGVVENMFHDVNKTHNKIKKNIGRILEDDITRESFKKARPKSTKMRLLTVPYRIKWIEGIYLSSLIIFYIKVHNPELFHKLRQKR